MLQKLYCNVHGYDLQVLLYTDWQCVTWRLGDVMIGDTDRTYNTAAYIL